MDSLTTLASRLTWVEALCVFNTGWVVLKIVKDLALGETTKYGRFTDAKGEVGSKFEWRLDFPLEPRRAWFLMEVPNLVISAVVIAWFAYAELSGIKPPASFRAWFTVFLFEFHYVVRVFVYSSLIRGGKPFPLHMLLLGGFFTIINGLVQSYHHLQEAKYGPVTERDVIQMVVGLSIFWIGFGINQICDTMLRNLRKPDGKDTAYYIPRGFLFEYLSAPNLVGEIIEWLGYGIFGGTLVSMGFFVSTFAVVGARSINTHDWYVTKFKEEYKKLGRSRLIPGVF